MGDSTLVFMFLCSPSGNNSNCRWYQWCSSEARANRFEFGRALCARIIVYKALYRIFGGFIASAVAALNQTARDGVDILNLSEGPNSSPTNTKTTFLNPFVATFLSAVTAGVFVVQAVVTTAVDDQRYKNHLLLVQGNTLLSSYSFNFVVGTSSIKKVSETAMSLGGVGFVLAVETISPWTKYGHIPLGYPIILNIDVEKSMELIDYYISTERELTGRVTSLNVEGNIGVGLEPILQNSAPQRLNSREKRTTIVFDPGGNTEVTEVVIDLQIKESSLEDKSVLKRVVLLGTWVMWARTLIPRSYKLPKEAQGKGTLLHSVLLRLLPGIRIFCCLLLLA